MKTHSLVVLLAAGLVGAGGCGGDPSGDVADETVDVQRSAFSVESCDDVTANSFMSHPAFRGGPNPLSVTSPTTYNNCYKGYVVDVTHAEASFGLPETGWLKRATVKYAGPIPLTKAACEDLTGKAILYYSDDDFGTGWIYPEQYSAAGAWVRPTGLNWHCSTPTMTFWVAPSYQARIAATMRRSAGTITEKVKVTIETIVFNGL